MSERTRQARRRPLWWVAMLLCLTYAAGVFALLALRFLLPVWPPLLVLLGFLGPFLYAPLVLLLPLAFLGRARVAMAATLAVLALFLVNYLPFFLPRLAAAPATVAPPITVMTFNLGASRSSAGQLAQAIESTGAGIVAVQELVPETSAGLREELHELYPHQILDTNVAASGLLSRYPILSSEWFQPAGHGRPALHATIDLDGVPLQVIVVHPQPPGIDWLDGRIPLPVGVHDRTVHEQVADIAERVGALQGPLIVMGDFNMGDHSRAYQQLADTLHDAFRASGWGFGFTFPNHLQERGIRVPGPLIRIDYVFHSDALYARRAYVGCRGGSDHCYVVAELSRVLP